MNRHVNPEDSDLYALGALDGEERLELEAHVRSCDSCAREVDAARQRVALLALAAPAAAPPARVKDALMRKVRADRVPETHRAMREPEKTRGFGLGWLAPMFGVATVVFAGLAVVFWTRDARDLERIHALEGQLAEVQTRSQQIARASGEANELLEWPGTRRVALMPQPGMPKGRAGVLYNREMGMVACAGWLPAPPSGKSYQLWLVPAQGSPMSLHVFGSGEWDKPMAMHVSPGMEAKAFAVTEEPEGGMPTPTGPKILVGVGE
ncbi:MAG TPA: anti-sigma factor [Acidobacteriaceae bacterium]|jgi:anti-sigma-K factor RskA|nr:anti-sigma factor [Acidobacteriaceae bacterium]